jgi:anti-sigma-K factor RskA
MSDLSEHDPDDVLAAEYALGTLDDTAREQARQRLSVDPAFSARVTHWEMTLAPLASYAEPVEPPRRIWHRIATATAAARPDGFVPAFWKWLALGSGSLAAASLAALVFVTRMEPEPTRIATNALVAGQDGQALLLVSIAPDGRTAMVTPVGLPQHSDRSLELWQIAADGAAHSLGLVPTGHTTQIRLVSPLADPAEDANVFAVSSEPQGGSPTGQPTGPVLGQGHARPI